MVLGSHYQVVVACGWPSDGAPVDQPYELYALLTALTGAPVDQPYELYALLTLVALYELLTLVVLYELLTLVELYALLTLLALVALLPALLTELLDDVPPHDPRGADKGRFLLEEPT